MVYEQSSPPIRKNILDIDCRGLEFTEFKANVRLSRSTPLLRWKAAKNSQGEWEAQGIESGTKFTGIDLSEGEWFDYDEKAGEEVSIINVTWDIRRA